MRTVKYQTENASFKFEINTVQTHLESRISEYNSPGNCRLLDLLLNSSEDSIEISPDDDSFGYIALELIENKTGQVTCKICDKTYDSSVLIPFDLGAGKDPLRPNIKIKRSLRSLFQRRKRNPSISGGQGFRCPAGHELIAMITWRT